MTTRPTTTLALVAGIASVACLLHPAVARAADLPDLEAIRPLLVQVEYTLKYDEGDAPSSAGWKLQCPNCGRYHINSIDADLVKQERPMRTGGFLLTPTLVLAPDPQIHPRFIDRICVRAGDKRIKAKPASFCSHENGWLLELEAPVPNAVSAQFDANAEPPYFAVTYTPADATWSVCIQPLKSGVTVTDDGRTYSDAPAGSLIVSSSGSPVGATMTGKIAAHDSWKGSPLDWPGCTAEEMNMSLANVSSVGSAGLLSVTLRFRSPKANDSIYSMSWRDDESDETESHAVGVLYGATEMLVLADLAPKRTARLEAVIVTSPDGEKIEAKYDWAMKDFGCFIATLPHPLEGVVAMDTKPIEALRDELIVSLQLRQFGDTHKSYALHTRIPGFALGHGGEVYPEVSQDAEGLFLFRLDAKLVAIPLTRRERIKAEEHYWYSDDALLTPVRYVLPELSDKKSNADPDNVPLSEADESRIAWLGVELQNLDEDLANANNISELTQNGEVGAIVSFVYPESPAEAAGVQVGDILLNIYSDQHYRPIPVRAAETYQFTIDFPWEALDEMPEEFMSQMPKPWPPVENLFTKTLTSLGFGADYDLEIYRAGASRKMTLKVVESPPYFDTAPRVESESLGMTVRNATYEVRRYFQMAADDSGVIISKIEPGLKAAVAGLRPYEIIKSVNDKPIHNVEDFEACLSSPPEGKLRMTVKRMTQSRVVVIRVAQPAEPATNDPE